MLMATDDDTPADGESTSGEAAFHLCADLGTH